MGFNTDAYGDATHDPYAAYEDSLSATVPAWTLTVFESIAMRDYDTPQRRAGVAIGVLESAGYVTRTNGDKQPVQLTERGRLLAQERGIPIMG